MVLVQRMDELGRAAWVAATIMGFWLFWPLGVAILMFLAWSGRMRAFRMQPSRWNKYSAWAPPFGSVWGGRFQYSAPSGNQAFDEYRAETLRRLEEEQREFVEYLERLRRAKDKEEFDQFMAERRRRGQSSDQVEIS
ncbi:MAG: DUF2852 domain-containing protein [Acetobacteraceae bacterium]|nr:DUF2852 domain-containing protein [Acetobacteraceae bacterium]MBV8522381.1 DUF2852 domain-containing protein [Acetobacteraceae bacterium]MBV8589625.1 DUF2852 domain-containing protein [Acetobacteraceae bacterium]